MRISNFVLQSRLATSPARAGATAPRTHRAWPARQEPAQSENGALRKAENLAKRMPGAAALKVVADDETGELEGVTILGQWGEVPDDFAESLQGS